MKTFLALLAACSFAQAERSELRVWTSSDGNFQVQAELVSLARETVKLRKLDGTVIDVPLVRLSAADRDYLQRPQAGGAPGAARAAEVSAAVAKFQKSMESIRPLEIHRLEKRLAELQVQLDAGRKNSRAEGLQDALASERQLRRRLNLLKLNEPYLPRLSPKDFAVGQIGEMDDEFVLEMQKPGRDEAIVSIMFDELRYFPGSKSLPAKWMHARVYRPDHFYLRSPIVAPLVRIERDGDPNCATNRLLRQYAYEIIERIPRGLISDYVLVPFDMEEIKSWLKTKPRP